MKRISRSVIITALITGLIVAAALGVIGWRYLKPYVNTMTAASATP
ncbi:hypothetical protein RBA13_22820 [Mycobacteroides abscessus subsp. massiliense]